MKPPAPQLPRLLASLPREGVSTLVRPVHWPENSFWRVNHSKLKFRTQEGKEELRVHGKAFGQLFWRGKHIPHPRKRQEKIPGALKFNWVQLHARDLDAATRAHVEATEVPVALIKPARVHIKARHKEAMKAAEEAKAKETSEQSA